MKAVKEKNEGGFAIQTIASIARKVARNNVSVACFAFVHQPKEPTNMEARLKSLHDQKTKGGTEL